MTRTVLIKATDFADAAAWEKFLAQFAVPLKAVDVSAIQCQVVDIRFLPAD